MDWIEEDRGYETPCWIWQRGTSRGYGWSGKDRNFAYRVVWIAVNGPIPDGKHLHHQCRQRICVRPDHLLLVTSTEHRLIHNGESGRRNRLTAEDVHDIRTSPLSLSDIALKHRISKSYASKVRRGQFPHAFAVSADQLPARPPTPERSWNRGRTRLSRSAVREIRESPKSLRQVASKHGISVAYASLIRRGEALAHL